MEPTHAGREPAFNPRGHLMKWMVGIAAAALLMAGAAQAQYLGGQRPVTLGGNPYGTDSNSPKIYDSDGQFRGNLNSNPYDPNSIANPYGRYGSRYSPDSLNNPYGAGNPYR